MVDKNDIPTIQNTPYAQAHRDGERQKKKPNNMKMNNNDKDNYQAVTIVCDNITQKVISTKTNKLEKKERSKSNRAYR